MASTQPQPIALRSGHSNHYDHGHGHGHDRDAHMRSGSLSSTPMGNAGSLGGSGSLTRYSNLLGSPVSWRAGSFGSRFYPSTSPGQMLGPLDPHEFKMVKASSSIESDRTNAFTMGEREDEMCRNFTCCGLHLTDLHALLEHFEDVHVVVVDPYTQQTQHAPHYPGVSQSQQPGPSSASAYAQQPHVFDPDDMELDTDGLSAPSSAAPSPPHTPLSPLDHHSPAHAHMQAHAHPAVPPASAFDTTAVPPARVSAFPPVSAYGAHRGSLTPGMPSPAAPHGDAFTAYGQYSPAHTQSEPGSPFAAVGVPPALLHSATPTPASSRVPSPTASSAPASPAPSPTTTTSGSGSARASSSASRPASSLLLSKPFRCPKPNCSKSYKQANGLKYHMTHGACSFAPPKDVREVQALLAARGANGGELAEDDMRELEREAERRLRPFACGVGECQRRYKNMNGLRYHYGHSGEHGAEGLRMLAAGTHECLRDRGHHHRGDARAGSGDGAGPSAGGSRDASASRHPSPAQAYGATATYEQWEATFAQAQEAKYTPPAVQTQVAGQVQRGSPYASPVAQSAFSSAGSSPAPPFAGPAYAQDQAQQAQVFGQQAQAQAYAPPAQEQVYASPVREQTYASSPAHEQRQQPLVYPTQEQLAAGVQALGFAQAQTTTYSSLDPMRVAYAQQQQQHQQGQGQGGFGMGG